MTLEDRLAQRKADMVDKWRDLIFATYPEETQKVWRKSKDRFTNPVGIAIRDATDRLFDLILAWDNADDIARALDQLVKIRAVQSFAPSKALSFVFLFKRVLRETFMAELKAEGALEELLHFEARVDNLALIAMDLYARDREAILQMRIDEVKRTHHNIVRRANKMDNPA